MLFPFISLLQIGSGTAQVIDWLADLTEASQILDYIVMCITYINFHAALKAQGISRDTLPYKGWGQPYMAWVALILMTCTVGTYGYTTFLPGYFTLSGFFSYYLMVFVCPVLYLGWKLLKRTKYRKPSEVDLVWERPTIDAYEASFTTEPLGFWEELAYMSGAKKRKVTTHVE